MYNMNRRGIVFLCTKWVICFNFIPYDMNTGCYWMKVILSWICHSIYVNKGMLTSMIICVNIPHRMVPLFNYILKLYLALDLFPLSDVTVELFVGIMTSGWDACSNRKHLLTYICIMTFKVIFTNLHVCVCVCMCVCVGVHYVDAVVDWTTEILYLHAVADHIVQVIHNCMQPESPEFHGAKLCCLRLNVWVPTVPCLVLSYDC